MYRLALGMVAAIAFACGPKEKNNEVAYTQAEIAAESEKANDMFERAFNDVVDRSPMTQGYLGIQDNNDQWDDLSDAKKRGDVELVKSYMQAAKDSINYDMLDEATKVSYDLFMQQGESEIEAFKYRFHDYPVNQMFGTHSQIASFLINMHQVNDSSAAAAYLVRLQKVPQLFEQLIKNLEQREAQGIMPPKFVFPKVIDDSQNIITGAPFDDGKPSTLLADFTRKVDRISISEAQKDAFKQQANQVLKDNVYPAYTSLIAFLKGQHERATNDDGAWKLPDGEAYYNSILQRTTTTKLTADEIHEIGLKEVARIHEEMRQIMKKVNFEGDMQAFFEFMRTDEQFYYPSDEAGQQQYLDSATAIIDNMRNRLDELFLTKPKASIIVKRVEPFREKSAGKAFYQAPAIDGSRPGLYYANLYDMKTMPKYQMEALAYHEGIPGHHMQLAIAQELKAVPKFRKFGGYTAYIEGWGLYCELIPKEMGLYANPYSDFGRLAMELWRACRLVVDTGIHAKKWTRQQGIDYYKSNTPDAESDCIRMVERHIVMPSQATAYKIGMIKIQELRKKAKDALGDQFDIREYHDVVLTNGAVPLTTLEQLVDKWIASKQS